MKTKLLLLLTTLIFIGCNQTYESMVTNYQECAAAGNPIMESYPQQCSARGETYTQDIGNELEKSDLITIDNPRPTQKITTPLEVTGKARGYWFFEANFPVELQDESGQVIANGTATADGDWMTDDFVPFIANLTYTKPSKESGTLILKRSNASGLPENDDQLSLPILFD